MANGNGKTGKYLGIAAGLLTWLTTLLTVAWYASADRTEAFMRIDANQQHIADHECRLRKLEAIAGDVRWIREHMESWSPE